MTSHDRQHPKAYSDQWWTIELPAGWRVKEEQECTSFFASSRVGILRVSAAKKPDGAITEEDVAEFAYDSKAPQAAIRPVMTSHTSGLYAEYRAGDVYWREWWLKGKSVLVFITYNVAFSKKEDEAALVDQTISSLVVKA